MNVKEKLLPYIGGRIKKIIENIDVDILFKAEEIRIRAHRPFIVKALGQELYYTDLGEVCGIAGAFRPDTSDIMQTIDMMSNYSLYALAEELKNGYMTLSGGFRVGIAGKVVIENGVVRTIKNISGLNIRIPHEVKGCSDKVLDLIREGEILHTVIISPPGCGKTTLLRDIVRNISNGTDGQFKGLNVSVVDERSEIGGCYMGIPQSDLGLRTDVLDGCPKAQGMIMLLRSMSPDVIAVDEIGSNNDIDAIDAVINSGIKLICTVHGNSIEDIVKKPVLSELINKNIFRRFIVLGNERGAGTVKGIYNETFQNIWGGC